VLICAHRGEPDGPGARRPWHGRIARGPKCNNFSVAGSPLEPGTSAPGHTTADGLTGLNRSELLRPSTPHFTALFQTGPHPTRGGRLKGASADAPEDIRPLRRGCMRPSPCPACPAWLAPRAPASAPREAPLSPSARRLDHKPQGSDGTGMCTESRAAELISQRDPSVNGGHGTREEGAACSAFRSANKAS